MHNFITYAGSDKYFNVALQASLGFLVLIFMTLSTVSIAYFFFNRKKMSAQINHLQGEIRELSTVYEDIDVQNITMMEENKAYSKVCPSQIENSEV